MSERTQGMVPMLSYRDGAAAMEWLTRVFGFEVRERRLDDDLVLTHGEIPTGAGMIMLATPIPQPRDVEGHRWMFMQRGD